MVGWGEDHDTAGPENSWPNVAGHAAAAPVSGWEESPGAAVHLHGTPGEHERLDLNDGDRLPWLESDEDEYFEKVSPGRVIAAGVGAFLVVGAVVGGIWWSTHHNAPSAPVPDGSTVAPAIAQYKEAPANPGGKTFQGTGDTSYGVSQGQNREAQLADGGADAAGGAAGNAKSAGAAPGKVAASDKSGGEPERTPAVATAHVTSAGDAAPAGGVVQIGAFSTRDLAEAGWGRLSGQHPLLAQQHHRILQGQADIGTVWRLQVVTGAGGGTGLCERLKGEGLSCQVKR